MTVNARDFFKGSDTGSPEREATQGFYPHICRQHKATRVGNTKQHASATQNNTRRGSCLKTGQHSIFVIIRRIKNWYTYVGYHKLMILYTLWSNIFNIRIIIIIIDNKKNKQYGIFDTESKIIHFMVIYIYNYKNKVLACFQTKPRVGNTKQHASATQSNTRPCVALCRCT